MKYSAKQYAEALFDSLSVTAPKDQDRVLENFVTTLAQNNDLRLFDLIAEEFHRIELKAKGQTLAKVTTATPLTAQAEKNIIKQLNEAIKGKVEIQKKIDKDLVGGVLIQMEDVQIDASVKHSLENLKNNLSE